MRVPPPPGSRRVRSPHPPPRPRARPRAARRRARRRRAAGARRAVVVRGAACRARSPRGPLRDARPAPLPDPRDDGRRPRRLALLSAVRRRRCRLLVRSGAEVEVRNETRGRQRSRRAPVGLMALMFIFAWGSPFIRGGACAPRPPRAAAARARAGPGRLRARRPQGGGRSPLPALLRRRGLRRGRGGDRRGARVHPRPGALRPPGRAPPARRHALRPPAARARPSWPRPSPARPGSPSTPSRARTSWRSTWARAPPGPRALRPGARRGDGRRHLHRRDRRRGPPPRLRRGRLELREREDAEPAPRRARRLRHERARGLPGRDDRLDTLDEALLRPGRFGRQILVDVPSRPGRLEILHLHGRGKPFGHDVDL